MSLPDTFVVIGRPYGPCRSTTEKSVLFSVFSMFRDLEMKDEIKPTLASIPISPNTSLPSYCPFLKYQLLVHRKSIGSVYDVLEVSNVEKLYQELTKKHLREYLLDYKGLKKGSNMYVGIMKSTVKIPQVIKSKDDIVRSVESEKMRSWILSEIGILFKSSSYYKLLKYFHEAFLNLFDVWELDVMYRLVMYRPYVFCFRSLMWRVLNDIKLERTHNFQYLNANVAMVLFPKEDPKIPNSLPRWVKQAKLSKWYCLGEDNLNRLLAKGKGYHTTFYSPNYYTWSIKTLAAALIHDPPENEIEDPVDHFDYRLHEKALAYYLECEGKRINYGVTTNLEPEDGGVKQFLINKKIMREWINPQTKKFELSYPEQDVNDSLLVEILKYRVKTVEMVDCHFYNEKYQAKLSQVITNIQKKEKKPDCICLISTGHDMACELTSRTGFLFFSLSEYVEVYKIKEALDSILSKDPIVMLDRAHKATTDQLLSLLIPLTSRYDPSRPNETKLKRLILLGDAAELQNCDPQCSGYGNPYLDLWHYAKFVKKGVWNSTSLDIVVNPSIVRSSSTTSSNTKETTTTVDYSDDVRYGIMDMDQSKLDIVTIDSIDDIPGKLKEWSKTIKNTKKEEKLISVQNGDNKKGGGGGTVTKQSTIEKRIALKCQIFVSSQYDKDMVMQALKKADREKYERNMFKQNDYVNVVDMGIIGQIKRITVLEKGKTSGQPTMLPDVCRLNQFVYSLLISSVHKDYLIITDEHTIVSHDVEVIGQYIGTPVDYAIFYVGDYTSEIDVVTAAKYTKKAFQIFIRSDSSLMNIYKGRNDNSKRTGFDRLSMQRYVRPVSALEEKILLANKITEEEEEDKKNQQDVIPPSIKKIKLTQ